MGCPWKRGPSILAYCYDNITCSDIIRYHWMSIWKWLWMKDKEGHALLIRISRSRKVIVPQIGMVWDDFFLENKTCCPVLLTSTIQCTGSLILLSKTRIVRISGHYLIERLQVFVPRSDKVLVENNWSYFPQTRWNFLACTSGLSVLSEMQRKLYVIKDCPFTKWLRLARLNLGDLPARLLLLSHELLKKDVL